MLFLSHRPLRSFIPYGWLLAAVATHGTTVASSLDTKSHTKKKIHGKSLRTRKYKGTYGKKDGHKPSAAKSKQAQGRHLYLKLGAGLCFVIAIWYSLLEHQGDDGDDTTHKDDAKSNHGSDDDTNDHDDKSNHGSDDDTNDHDDKLNHDSDDDTNDHDSIENNTPDPAQLLQDIFDNQCNITVQKPSMPNVFANFVCGYQEMQYEDDLGPLEDVKLEACELNPNVLQANVHANVDLSQYPTTLDQAQTKILNLFIRARLPKDMTFANAKDKEDDNTYNLVKTLKDLLDFADDMGKKPRLTNEAKQMLNQVIDQLHQLDIGQANQEDDKLTPEQRANRFLAREILPNIPVIQAECHATTISFVNQTGAMLKLKTLASTTFTGRVLSYLEGQLGIKLDAAIHEFLPMRRAHVRGEKIEDAKTGYWQGFDKKDKNQQHLMNGLKAGCHAYIRASTGVDTMNSPYAFTGDLDKHNRNEFDSINRQQLVTMFMQYYKGQYLDPKTILGNITNAIMYSGIPAKYYQAFAQKKGFNKAILNDNGSPKQDVLRKFLLNIGVFQRKR